MAKRIIVFLLILIFLYFVASFATQIYHSKKSVEIMMGDDGEISLGINQPIFHSNKKGSTLKIKSSKAKEIEKNQIRFFDIEGENNDGGKNYLFDSKEAIFSQDDNILDFLEIVNITNKDDFILMAPKARFFIKKELIEGVNSIYFRNKIGEFNSLKFSLNLALKSYIFEKKAKLKFDGVLQADFINAIETDKKIIAKNNIYYQKENLIINCDNLTAFYSGNETVEIEKMIAKGSLKIKQDEFFITGKIAYIYPKKDIIEIEDKVIIIQNNKKILADKLIYNLKDKSYRILNKDDKKVKIRIKNQK